MTKKDVRTYRHLRVPVYESEKEQIQNNAAKANLTIASYMRKTALAQKIQNHDALDKVSELSELKNLLAKISKALENQVSFEYLAKDAKLAFDSITSIQSVLVGKRK